MGLHVNPSESAAKPALVLAGRIVAAGAASCRALGDLLGIHVPGKPWQVTAVAWVDHAVELTVEGTPEPLVGRIERRTPESKGLALTTHLNIYFRGKSLPTELSQHVAAKAPAALESWSLDELALLLRKDPELGKPGLAVPPNPDEGRRPRSLLDTWAGEDAFADFFAGGEIARSQLDSIDPSKLFHFVQHCDAECLYVNPHTVGTIVALVNYPWDDRVREPSRPTAQGLGNVSDPQVVEEGMVTTDIDENDVILGNPKRLSDVVEYAASRPNPENKLIFVSNTCVPTVIGEDVESVVKRVRQRTGLPILYLTVTPRSMTNVFEGILVDRRMNAEAEAPPPRPDAINLIGFSGAKAVPELESLLQSAGVHVNTRLLPDLDTARIDALPGAAINIVLANKTWEHLYNQVMDRSRTRSVVLEAPYGWEATRRWLQGVVHALGLETDTQACWEQHTGAWLERWEALRKRASGLRVGMVVRDQESYYLTTPPSTWGVPLIGALEEMGFGIDILMHVTDPQTAKESALTIRKMFGQPARHTIRAFDSFAFLRQRLADCPAQAFLSYNFFDWRLTEAGKAAFSIQHFELGAAGAVRTLDRILGVCSTPFYQRYKKHLARTAEGLRSPAKAGGR
ncbi:MAG: hypothetical protein HY898_17335 [Deltaproteobacteria bacterium]|nr:hypothetical protein [Deltaproteobacteria bacterium]